jgi:hypothetical protein
MFRHVVSLKFKTHEPEAECKQLVRDLADLPNQVPEILHWSTGCNEINIDLAYDVAIVGDFENREALLRYFKHPAVQAVLAKIDRLCSSRISVDYSTN